MCYYECRFKCIFHKKDKKQLSWFITFIVPALIFFIPTTETFSYEIKLFMVFTLWGILMFAFELMNTLIPSLILPFLYVIFNLVPMSVAFSAWTTTVPWMCLGGFLLANILERIGLLKRMAYWCIIKTGGTYKGIVWGMFFFGIALNLALPGGSAVGVAAFAFGICRALNLGRSQAAAGIMISAALGNLLPGYFIYYPGNFGILFSIGQSVAPITIDYTTYLYHNAIFIPFGFILIFLITKIIKPEVSIDGKNYFIQEQKALGKITVPEKKRQLQFWCF